MLTGIAGVAALAGGTMLLRDWLAPGHIKSLAVVALAAAAMVLADVGIYRVHRNAETGLALAHVRPLDWRRLGLKLLGFWLSCCLAATPYWVIPEFSRDFFQPFRAAALFVLPGLLIISPFYIAYVDRRQHQPDDAYAQLGGLMLGRPPADKGPLLAHARGWLIKAFFLPLMFVFVNRDLGQLWSVPLLPERFDFEHVFSRAIDFIYLVDVFLAVIAYAATLRTLDTHVRSAEPTVLGWVVCLACYQPFNSITSALFPYDQDGLSWGGVFDRSPLLYTLWGSAILVLACIYVSATVVFGLRFSNLTHRGIITAGAFRWTKHPAYLSKNISWWMISVPFIAGAGWLQAVQSCLLLGGVNLIYFLRARTEERHLGRDPVYRDYAAFIAKHGLFAVARRTLTQTGLRLATRLRSPA